MMWIFKRYWRLILALTSLSILVGSLYFLYERSVSLEKSLQKSEYALQASERAVQALKKDRDIISKVNKENAKRKAEIQSKLYSTQTELDKLKRESIQNDEEGSKCLGISVPKSINDRLREQSNKGGGN